MTPADGETSKCVKIEEISKVAKEYYDSDNAFNFYRQVCMSL